ncbi:MAG: 4Fe-4S binding protein [bacterium]
MGCKEIGVRSDVFFTLYFLLPYFQEKGGNKEMPAIVDTEKCDGCGTCVEVCPTEAIALEDDVAQVNEDECTECGTCVEECPNGAISMSE